MHCSVWFVSSVLALSPGTRWPQRRGGLTCTHRKASPYRQTWGEGGQAALSALVAASLSSAQNTFTPKWPTCTVFRSPDVVKQGIPSSVGAGEAPSTRAHGEEPGGVKITSLAWVVGSPLLKFFKLYLFSHTHKILSFERQQEFVRERKKATFCPK